MTLHELSILTNFLHGLYKDRFPGLTEGMAQMWYDDLMDYPADLVIRGAKRWARHHTLKAPSLDELMESIEWVREQDLKARLPQKPTNPFQEVEAMQRHAQGAHPEWTTADKVFGKLMIRLLEHCTGQRGKRYTMADCAAHLMTWVEYYRPKSRELAAWLEAQIPRYQDLATQEYAHRATARTGLSLATLGEARTHTPLPSYDQDLPCVHADVREGVCVDCGEIFLSAAAD